MPLLDMSSTKFAFYDPPGVGMMSSSQSENEMVDRVLSAAQHAQNAEQSSHRITVSESFLPPLMKKDEPSMEGEEKEFRMADDDALSLQHEEKYGALPLLKSVSTTAVIPCDDEEQPTVLMASPLQILVTPPQVMCPPTAPPGAPSHRRRRRGAVNSRKRRLEFNGMGDGDGMEDDDEDDAVSESSAGSHPSQKLKVG
jgi:hypothetical protein